MISWPWALWVECASGPGLRVCRGEPSRLPRLSALCCAEPWQLSQQLRFSAACCTACQARLRNTLDSCHALRVHAVRSLSVKRFLVSRPVSCLLSVPHCRRDAQQHSLTFLRGLVSACVTSLSWSPSGRLLAGASEGAAGFHVWDAASGRGTRIAAGGWADCWGADAVCV